MARIFLDEMGGINQGGILASYGLPVSPFSTEEYAPTIVETPSRPTHARKKQSKSKPKRNDGIIRNHDSVWDYKIQDGKLLTRRKTSDGKWYDITNNDEARQRIEQFTGRTISNKQSASNNSSQSQVNKPADTTQTQRPARPAASQPVRQQAARQDSTRRDTVATQQARSLASTPASNREPNWQNMTDAEVEAWFNNNSYGLPEVTVTAKGNTNRKKNQLLSQEDLDANGWKWSDKIRGINDYGPLFEDAYNRTQQGEKILTDIEGRIIPKSEVNRYINRGRIPLYLSDYDAQFYQPQSENGTLRDVRQAQDRRRNYQFDKQRNIALGTAFGIPALVGGVATAPITTLAALGSGELFNIAAKGYGFDYDKWVSGKNDANAEFYGPMTNPFRIAGNVIGGIAGNAIQPKVSEAVNPYINRTVSWLTDKFGNIGAPSRNIAYPALAQTEETQVSIELARAMQDALNPRGTNRQLAKAMNKSLKNKDLVQRERQMLAEDVPYLFDPEMTSSNYYYPLNPTMEGTRMGPYGIPNHVNGIPFGTPVPRVLGAIPESGTTLALPIKPGNSLQPMPDAFGYYGVPYRRPVQVMQSEQPRVVVKSSAKKQYPKQKGKKKKK